MRDTQNGRAETPDDEAGKIRVLPTNRKSRRAEAASDDR